MTIPYPSTVAAQPLVELGLDEELEEPASYHSHERNDQPSTTHPLADESLTQAVAVGQQGSYSPDIDLGCIRVCVCMKEIEDVQNEDTIQKQYIHNEIHNEKNIAIVYDTIQRTLYV